MKKTGVPQENIAVQKIEGNSQREDDDGRNHGPDQRRLMKGVLVDSNIILDVFLDDKKWADWSESKLEEYGAVHTSLYINSIIYSEISIGFKLIEDLEAAVSQAGFQLLEIPKEALFLAGKAFLKYKRRKGVKRTPLPDFFIGAQAAVLNLDLLTRDVSRYQSYFPTVKLIAPLPRCESKSRSIYHCAFMLRGCPLWPPVVK